MGQSRLTSVDPVMFRDQMWDFLCVCVTSPPSEQVDRIREANHLFRLVSDVFDISLPVPKEEKDLEARLAAGAGESAAIQLLARGTGFMLSRGSNHSNLATVVLPGRTEEFTATGQTLALALLAAQTSALLAEVEQVLERSSGGMADARRQRPLAKGEKPHR